MPSSRNEYLTYVQLPSEGGQIGTQADGVPVQEAPWHPIPNSRIRTERAHPDGLRRSREIARDLYPLYPLRTDQLSTAQPAGPPEPLPTPFSCRYPNIIFASFEGIFEDNGTDQTSLLEAACLKAIAQDMPLVLDVHRIRSSRPFRLDDLPPFSNLRIYSFIGTQIIISPNTNGNPWGSINGQELIGTTPVNFNSGGGDVPQDSFPLTSLTQPDGPGWTATIPAGTATLIQPGYLIKIQTKRLPVAEHRFCMYVGELNRVRSITTGGVIELDTKLRHNYRPGTLFTSTVTASSAIISDPPKGRRLVTIADAPPADLPMFGLLTTSFDGTERNLQWWDAATRTFSFPFGSNNDQFDYSPPVGSTITFSANPYVFIYPPIFVTISGVTIDATEDVGLTTRGLSIAGADQPIIEDFQTINCQSWGLNLNKCFEPSVRFSRNDRSNDDNLGYTIIFSETRGGSVDGYHSHNNRRMTDSGGQCQSIGTHITNFQVNGGWKQNLGQEWDAEEPEVPSEEINYGLGDHGQSLDWVWENGIVRDVKFGAVFRGGGETIRNVRFEGYFARVFSFGAGERRVIENIQVDDRIAPTEFLDPQSGLHYVENNTPVFIDCPAFTYANSGNTYQGPATVRNITINGSVNYFIFFDNGHELGQEVRDWIIDGVAWRTPVGGSNCHIFKADDVDNPGIEIVSLQNFTLTNVVVYYRGRPESILSETGGGVFIRNNSWMRTGTGRYRFRLSDDGRLEFPFAIAKSGVDPGNLYRLVTYPSAPLASPSSDWYADILVEAHFGNIVREISPLIRVTIQDLEDLGVSDPDGSLNIARDPSASTVIVMKNRLGEEIWGVLELSQ